MYASRFSINKLILIRMFYIGNECVSIYHKQIYAYEWIRYWQSMHLDLLKANQCLRVEIDYGNEGIRLYQNQIYNGLIVDIGYQWVLSEGDD